MRRRLGWVFSALGIEKGELLDHVLRRKDDSFGLFFERFAQSKGIR